MKKFPTTIQELFEFAIAQTVSVIGEFYDSEDYWKLRLWALGFARARGLQLSDNFETFGIYAAPNEEEIEELKQKGLWE